MDLRPLFKPAAPVVDPARQLTTPPAPPSPTKATGKSLRQQLQPVLGLLLVGGIAYLVSPEVQGWVRTAGSWITHPVEMYSCNIEKGLPLELCHVGVAVQSAVEDVAGRADAKARTCDELWADARGNLKALYVSEEVHRADHDAYTADLALTGFGPKWKATDRPDGNYEFAVVSAKKDSFRARATGRAGTEVEGDAWEVTERGAPEHKRERCGL